MWSLFFQSFNLWLVTLTHLIILCELLNYWNLHLTQQKENPINFVLGHAISVHGQFAEARFLKWGSGLKCFNKYSCLGKRSVNFMVHSPETVKFCSINIFLLQQGWSSQRISNPCSGFRVYRKSQFITFGIKSVKLFIHPRCDGCLALPNQIECQYYMYVVQLFNEFNTDKPLFNCTVSIV